MHKYYICFQTEDNLAKFVNVWLTELTKITNIKTLKYWIKEHYRGNKLNMRKYEDNTKDDKVIKINFKILEECRNPNTG